MYLKLMSGEDAPDSDSRKSFTIHSGVLSCDFGRNGPQGQATAYVVFERGDPETFTLEGNAYLMNEAGKTIGQFGPMPIPSPAAHRQHSNRDAL